MTSENLFGDPQLGASAIYPFSIIYIGNTIVQGDIVINYFKWIEHITLIGLSQVCILLVKENNKLADLSIAFFEYTYCVNISCKLQPHIDFLWWLM